MDPPYESITSKKLAPRIKNQTTVGLRGRLSTIIGCKDQINKFRDHYKNSTKREDFNFHENGDMVVQIGV